MAAADEDDPVPLIRRSLRIKRERGPEAADEFLDEHGISTVRKSTKLSGDAVSTQRIEDVRTTGVKPELTGYKSVYNPDKYYVTFDAELHCEVVCKDSGWLEPKRYFTESFGSGPADGAIVAWNTPNEAYFDLPNELDSVAFGDQFSYQEYADRGAIVADVDDTQACVDWWNENRPDGVREGHPSQKLCKTDVWGTPKPKRVTGDAYAGNVVLTLEPVNDHSPERRTVNASYTHAYKDTRVLGGDVSFGFGLSGPTVTINPESKIRQVSTDTTEGGYSDGELLQLTQAEMDDN